MARLKGNVIPRLAVIGTEWFAVGRAIETAAGAAM
jgi:hypothetical protein